MKSLDYYWYSFNSVSVLLWPVSLLFLLLVTIRRFFYKAGILQSFKASKPVVVIGNITVGGTGKTPLIIKLCELLKDWGYKPGVISRGYGGTGPWPHQLDDHSSAEKSGDEPVQIYQRSAVPVVVGPDRKTDIDLLVNNNEVDLVLADDGLQHYRLQRDLELIVVDQQRQFGNRMLIPAGPLREPVSRINANAKSWKVLNGGEDDFSYKIHFNKARHLLSGREEPVSFFTTTKVHAIAGIGHPDRFFTMLKDAGLDVIEHAFADHHSFSEQELMFNDNLPVLMTEKDSVKCRGFKLDNLWYLPIDIELTENFINQFKEKVNELVHG